MDTGIWILVIALVLVMLAVVGFFFYKYYLEPHHVLDHILHHDSVHTSTSHVSPHSEGSSSMAGHLINKMSKAKKHSNKAIKKIGQAKVHLNKAQAHAAHA